MKLSSEVKTDLLKRLKRLEGQVRGVQRMIDDERDCKEIVQQLSAIRSAAHQTSLALIREHASACLLTPGESASPQDVLDSLFSVLDRV